MPDQSVDYGAKWVAASSEAVLVIPSVIILQEDNVLVNPRHPDFAAIHAANRGRVEYDHDYSQGCADSSARPITGTSRSTLLQAYSSP